MSFFTGRTPQYKVHQTDGSVRVFRNAASAARYVVHLTQTGADDKVCGYEASGETKELRQRRTEAIRNEIEKFSGAVANTNRVAAIMKLIPREDMQTATDHSKET